MEVEGKALQEDLRALEGSSRDPLVLPSPRTVPGLEPPNYNAQRLSFAEDNAGLGKEKQIEHEIIGIFRLQRGCNKQRKAA